MIWQEFIFLFGAVVSIFVLAPVLRDRFAYVPLHTSLPSTALGVLYSTTFFTMDLYVSAMGSLVGGLMWAAIAIRRSRPFSVEPVAEEADHI